MVFWLRLFDLRAFLFDLKGETVVSRCFLALTLVLITWFGSANGLLIVKAGGRDGSLAYTFGYMVWFG
jgi:hypothetical protein